VSGVAVVVVSGVAVVVVSGVVVSGVAVVVVSGVAVVVVSTVAVVVVSGVVVSSVAVVFLGVPVIPAAAAALAFFFSQKFDGTQNDGASLRQKKPWSLCSTMFSGPNVVNLFTIVLYRFLY
jgi:hypothetical protein